MQDGEGHGLAQPARGGDRSRMRAPLPIVPFRPDLAPAFGELNRAWIEDLFRMEEADRKVTASASVSARPPWTLPAGPVPI